MNANLKKVLYQASKHKTALFLFADAVLIALSVVLAFAVRFELAIPGHYFSSIVRLALLCEIFTIPLFFYQRLYNFSWSYVSTQDLIALLKAVFLSFLMTGGALFVFRESPYFSGFPRSTVFIAYSFIFVFCGGIRFLKRLYLHSFTKNGASGKERTLIVGAGDAGEQIARSILNSKISPYFTVGFVDDNRTRWGDLIHGVKVLGPIDKIPEITAKLSVTEMIIALPSAGSTAIKKAVELGRSAGLKKIKIVPSIFEIIDGKINANNIRQVDVEDLLEREPVKIDTQAIEQFIRNKVILITGGAGSIGSELCRQAAKFKPERLLILDQDETGIFNIIKELRKNYPQQAVVSFIADICDEEKISHILNNYRPEVVFHAAAYKHVPLMEEDPREAAKNNIFGTKTVAEAALAAHVKKFIMISTDKAVNPTSVMGVTKRVCEMVCQNLNSQNSTKFISVRFGNVLNSRGSVIPIFREQIRRGGPVEVTHPEMKRYFMLTSEACLLVMQAGAMGSGGEVFVLNMGKPVNILEMAREMIRLSGFEPDKDIPIVFIGLRPGEKLFEEFLTAEEGAVATQNEKIFIARLSMAEENKLKSCLERLKAAFTRDDRQEIKKVFKDIIPVYAPFLEGNPASLTQYPSRDMQK